jgi:hypothetical protein
MVEKDSSIYMTLDCEESVLLRFDTLKGEFATNQFKSTNTVRNKFSDLINFIDMNKNLSVRSLGILSLNCISLFILF